MQVVRRLPGVRFETQPPESAEVLPRMDVAAFVGFAASGPIGIPVPVADPAGFAAIFGGDVPLARDPNSNATVSAYLAPAVRAFFRNGGRRCFVIRVADRRTARRGKFSVPGLLVRTPDGIARASLRARSEGSWSDGLRVATAEALQGIELISLSLTTLSGAFALQRPGDLAAGDLLRIAEGEDEDERQLVAAVASVENLEPEGRAWNAGLRVRAVLDPASAVWMRRPDMEPRAGTVAFVGADGSGLRVPGKLVPHDYSSGAAEPSTVVLAMLGVQPAQMPVAGSLVRFSRRRADACWLAVDAVRARERGGCEIVGEPWALTTTRSREFLGFGTGATAHRVTFELRVEGGPRIAGLGFAPGHPRFIGDLPSDPCLYSGRATGELAAVAAEPRFPLAAGCGAFAFPLGMRGLADRSLGARHQHDCRLVRDGLAKHSEALFLDPRLADAGLEVLITNAQALGSHDDHSGFYGIHAILDLDEVTLLAFPDAVHRGWEPLEAQKTPPESCEETPNLPETPAGFADCSLGRRAHHTPELGVPVVDAAGTITLSWRSPDVGARYVVEEAPDQVWSQARQIDAGTSTQLALYGRPPGSYAYRVRAGGGADASPWSHPRFATVALPDQWVLLPAPDGPDTTLLSVQRAALRVAAARGDVFVALTLAPAAREDAAFAHVEALRAATLPRPTAAVPALDASEERALSYGAVYHPWPTTVVDSVGTLRRIPPDGAAVGMLAATAATRGAWVAAANEPLLDVVALEPPVPASSFQALQDGQLNVLRQEPAGFVCLSEDTLSRDADLRPINVRRLLSLLRRVALLHGTTYVFEPNDATLRRSVQRGFEALLTDMFQLGAFSGATPEQAFSVVVGGRGTATATVDDVRFVVELKVAPSLPLRFLTVRLVSTGERGLQILAA